MLQRLLSFIILIRTLCLFRHIGLLSSYPEFFGTLTKNVIGLTFYFSVLERRRLIEGEKKIDESILSIEFSVLSPPPSKMLKYFLLADEINIRIVSENIFSISKPLGSEEHF